MIKKISIIICLLIVFSYNNKVLACDENQTNTYIAQIIFGDDAIKMSNNEDVKILMNALYLCSEQSDNSGNEKIEYLKSKNVSNIPNISSINLSTKNLLSIAHNSWDYDNSKKFEKRKEILINSVNKVFDFGLINNLFPNKNDKCTSFAAMLYYSHILSDYLADDPDNTNTYIKGKEIPSYNGSPYYIINGDKPSFSSAQYNIPTSYVEYSQMDSLGRAGQIIANIGPDIVSEVTDRENISGIKPSGWHTIRYDGIVNSKPGYLFNRCHLLAHCLGGADSEINLITGTRYMNANGMQPIEEQILSYINESNNHVLYRVTPIYKNTNKVASGVQIEAYSVEDSGKGVCINRYFYNVQPGIDINYINGLSKQLDIVSLSEDVIPFSTANASETNPDLIFEINKYLAILFKDQEDSMTYSSMIGEINTVAENARSINIRNTQSSQDYIALKNYQYEYFNILKTYIPKMLEKETFFNSKFN